jgi:hypothetical protein
MERPTLRIRPDGNEVVVLVDLVGGHEIPIGVGDSTTAALWDARATLAEALAAIDDAIADLDFARRARRAVAPVGEW